MWLGYKGKRLEYGSKFLPLDSPTPFGRSHYISELTPSTLIYKIRMSDHTTQTFKDDSSSRTFQVCDPEPLNSVLLFLITPSLLFCADREVTSAGLVSQFY